MNLANNYILPFVPQDLKWYERDRLMTWYDQTKCKEFLQNLDNHFENTKIINFDISIRRLGVNKFLNQLWKLIRQLKKKKLFMNICLKKGKKIMSAGLRSTLKRNDVFVSEDLVKNYFLSPINGEKMFLFSMKKKTIWKKE